MNPNNNNDLLKSRSTIVNGTNNECEYSDDDNEDDNPKTVDDVKRFVMQGIAELLDELENTDNLLSEKAVDHFHSNEIVLTHGYSKSALAFFKAAAKKRAFTLIIVESYPDQKSESHEMAQQLSVIPSINVLVVPDAAAFAVMSRVNKVLLGAHSVLANGSLIAPAGADFIAEIAYSANVPVIVTAGLYKLSVLYPHDVEQLLVLDSPQAVLPIEEGIIKP